jgi:hypothetical protein
MDNEPFLKAITGDKGASNKSKHVMIKLHVIREAYDAGDIDFSHMKTENIPSEALTKLLYQRKYLHKSTFLMVRHP